MRQLYCCVIASSEEGKEKVFHASFIEKKGRGMVVGTSFPLERGHQVYLAPVPPNWDGKDLTVDEVKDHTDVIVANFGRAEGRGRYMLTCLSEKEREAYLSIRNGFIRDEGFSLETQESESIITIIIRGRVGFGSAGKFKAVLERNLQGGQPIIVDLRETEELSSLGMATLSSLLRELHRFRPQVALLVEPKSRIMRTLTQTRIGELVKIYSKPELAREVLKRTYLQKQNIACGKL